jgi:hypothetical protein
LDNLFISAVSRYRNRTWYLYLPLTILVFYWGINKIIDPNHWDFILSSFILAIHESGHFVFSAWGRFLNILGGSLVEAFFPFAFFVYFAWKRRYYDAAFCLMWLAYAYFEIATYMADAKVLALPLITDAIAPKIEAHDWYNLFSMLGLLEQSVAIANFMRVIAYFLLFTSAGIILWLQIVMFLGSGQNRDIVNPELANQIAPKPLT